MERDILSVFETIGKFFGLPTEEVKNGVLATTEETGDDPTICLGKEFWSFNKVLQNVGQSLYSAYSEDQNA